MEAPAAEEELPEPDMVREPPPTVLTIVTPAASTVVTTEPLERVLTTVAPAAFVVVSRAPAVREGEADAEVRLPAVVLVEAPESGLEVALDGEPEAEPVSVVAVFGLLEPEPVLEVDGPRGTGVTIGPDP